MKISRVINGQDIEIELTPTEMLKAYYEKQHQFDRQDIQDLYDWLDPDDIERTFHITKEKLDAGLDSMALDMRKNIDKWGDSWESARDCAFNNYLARHAC